MGFWFRGGNPVRTKGAIEWMVVPYSFAPNTSDSTANPLAASTFGPITFSWTATGTYRATLPGGSPRMIVSPPGVETALKGLFQLDVSNVNATAGIFDIKVYTFATTTLINFTATTSVQRVSGQLWVQASSYTRG